MTAESFPIHVHALLQVLVGHNQGCACFPELLQNFSESQIFWSLCSVVFQALTLKLPVQTSLSLAPKLPVSLCLGEIVNISGKQAHPRAQECCCFTACDNTHALLMLHTRIHLHKN